MIVIPTYNERPNVATVLSRIRAAVGDEPILFVDDSSPDGTAEEVRKLQKNDPNLHLLVRTTNRGFAAACREAYQKVMDENLADHVIQLDADLSHPPEALPTMLELLKTSPVVVGSRYVQGGGTKNWGLVRRLLSRGGNLYARLLTGVPLHDLTAGFMGYQVASLRKCGVENIRSEGYAFLIEMKCAVCRAGIRMREFPITFTERAAGESKFSIRIVLEGMLVPLKILLQRIWGRF
jgi:dolichol-phosphate mannosyltransferase